MSTFSLKNSLQDSLPNSQLAWRIAIFGWADLSKQEQEGSGYNLVASELAFGLSQLGHEVFYLNSGRNYDFSGKIYISKPKQWHGIQCYSIVNSKNFSPGTRNFGRLQYELHDSSQSEIIVNWLIDLDIQIVHIHSNEGFPLNLIPDIRQVGLPVIVTPHDYWYICPQVNLLYRGQEICMDFEGGKKCEGCMAKQKYWKIRLKRILVSLLNDTLLKLILSFLNKIKCAISKKGSDSFPFYSYSSHFNESFIRFQKLAIKKVLGNYGERRNTSIKALNKASLVTPPSQFLGDVYQSMGLQSEKVKMVRLGLSHLDEIRSITQKQQNYTLSPWEPKTTNRKLRICFLGSPGYHKGLLFLLKSINEIPFKILNKLQFLIYSNADSSYFSKQLISSLSDRVYFLGGYEISQLKKIINNYDIAIIPHLWFENSPIVLLENLCAGKFVVTSSLGGVLEWIDSPHNGLLFNAGDTSSLIEAIVKIVEGEVRIPSPQEIHKSTSLTSAQEYLNQNQMIYKNCLALNQNL